MERASRCFRKRYIGVVDDLIMKKKVIDFLIEMAVYILVVSILEIIFVNLGWIDADVLSSIIGLTLGYIIWKCIMYAIDRKRRS